MFYKRSQASQAFTYLAIILIIGGIALVGYKAISSILGANCDSKQSDFRLDMSKFLDKYSDRGSVHSEIISLPCEVSEICFVNASNLGDVGFTSSNQVIDSSVQDGAYNVFVKAKFWEPVLKSEKLNIANSKILCIDASNEHVKLRFTGLGRSILVEQG